MWIERSRRRQIRAMAPGWALELIGSHGRDAEAVIAACLEHPSYGREERYCFRAVRREVRRRQGIRRSPLAVVVTAVGSLAR